MRCVWLASRPEYVDELCQPDKDAYKYCPETCGVCTDDCEDGTSKFPLDGETRDCEWLALRPELKFDHCVLGEPAYNICGETCDVCDGNGQDVGNGDDTGDAAGAGDDTGDAAGDGSDTGNGDGTDPPKATPYPSPTPHPTPAPTKAATPKPTPTPTLSPNAAPVPVCDDTLFISLIIDQDTGQKEDCAWLALSATDDQRAELCKPGHTLAAALFCAETCGQCSDDCEDTDIEFLAHGEMQNCVWLALRPDEVDILCWIDPTVIDACPETCGKCDGTTSRSVGGSSTDGNDDAGDNPDGSQSNNTPTEKSGTAEYHSKYACDDSKWDYFYVEEINEYQRCYWLETHPEYQDSLCKEGNDAYVYCPETCGVCEDDCEDVLHARFDVGSKSNRDCEWLALRPEWHTDVCTPTHHAYWECQETCDVCDTLADDPYA